MREESFLVGRDTELLQIRSCLKAKRNVLLEGPVGVGKTHLALAASRELETAVYRIDGDSRYTEQKLTGWFDPPLVIKKGFTSETFIAGPLVEAMQRGGVLFINELNRLPEGIQNVLLPAIDERVLVIPRLGAIQASPDFLVIATQNPKEFVATSHLSEAILDRFELIVLDYQSEAEEVGIVGKHLKGNAAETTFLVSAAVKLVRISRNHPKVRRGASIRAAQSLSQIAKVLLVQGVALKEAFTSAALMALPTRIEVESEVKTEIQRSERSELEIMIREWVDQVFGELEGGRGQVKKKT